MFPTDPLLSTERWVLLILFDVSVRCIFQTLYFNLLDAHFSKTLGTIDLTLAVLEAACNFAVIILINDLTHVPVIFKAGAALELLKFLISVTLCIHSVLSFDSLGKLCLAILFLLLPSVIGFLDCLYGYSIIAYPRKPILLKARTSETAIHMDSYDQGAGPLSQAYQYQKERRQELNIQRVRERRIPSAEPDHLPQEVSFSRTYTFVVERFVLVTITQGLIYTPRASNIAEPVAIRATSSLQPYSSAEREHSYPEQADGALEEAQNLVLPSSTKPSFQTYPDFHVRTRTFEGSLFELIVRVAIIFTFFELIVGTVAIFSAHDVEMNLYR